MKHYYVDTDIAAAGDGTSWVLAKATLATAVALLPSNLTTDDAYTIHCKGVAADTTQVSLSGRTTDATHYIQIQVDQADRHAGVYSETNYRLIVSNSTALEILDDHIRIDGLQIGKSSSSANAQYGIYIGVIGAGSRIDISNTIVKQAGNDSYTEPGITIADADAVVNIWNCVVYGLGDISAAANSAIYVSSGTVTVYSSTLSGGYRGLANSSGTVVAKNCYASANSGAYYGTITKTTCASSDTTGSTGLQSVAKDADTFVSVIAGSEDFHLAADGNSPLKWTGTDTTGDSAPFNFTTDIDGETRGAIWDVGADGWGESSYPVTVSDLADDMNAL